MAWTFRGLAALLAAGSFVVLPAAESPGAAQVAVGTAGLSGAQRDSIGSLGIKVALPAAPPAGFHVEKVSVTPCPSGAARSASGTCRFGPSYVVVYRNAGDACFAVEETGGGIGGVSFTYAFTVSAPLFGNVAVQFGRFISARPQQPSAAQIAAPQAGLFTDWAGGGPFYRVIGADWVRSSYYGEKPGKPAAACRTEVTPALVADVERSLQWLAAFADKAAAQTSCFYDPKSSTPNPFGMRAFLSITGDGRSAVATYDMFPSNESGDPPNVRATLEERRQLKFYDLGVSSARRYLAKNPSVYQDLIGDGHPLMSYPEFDKHLTCKSAPPTPATSSG